jgi:hypothetical protein
MISIDPLIVFVIGVFLYYRPEAKSSKVDPPAEVARGKYAGHVQELLDRGHQWFEDPGFYLRKQ